MPTRGNIQEIDTGATPASSLTLAAYTPAAGSDRVVEVMIAMGRTSSPTVTVTFGGVAMTSRGGNVISGSTNCAVHAFTINEADWPATPADIVATLNGVGGIRIVASTIDGVDQTTPMDTTPVTYAPALNTNPWSIAIVTVTNDALVSSFGAGTDARTLSSVGAGQTQARLDTDIIEVGTIDIQRTLLWEDVVVPVAGTVTMVATWNSGHARTAGVTLAYRPAAAGPTITTQPSSQTVEEGANVTFTSAASTGTVQWQENIGGTPTNITGETAGSLTLNDVQLADDGRQFRAAWTDVNGTTFSNYATLTVGAVDIPSTMPASDALGDTSVSLSSTIPYDTTPGKFGVITASINGVEFKDYFLPETP